MSTFAMYSYILGSIYSPTCCYLSLPKLPSLSAAAAEPSSAAAEPSSAASAYPCSRRNPTLEQLLCNPAV
jgi:hypothetical protein